MSHEQKYAASFDGYNLQRTFYRPSKKSQVKKMWEARPLDLNEISATQNAPQYVVF